MRDILFFLLNLEQIYERFFFFFFWYFTTLVSQICHCKIFAIDQSYTYFATYRDDDQDNKTLSCAFINKFTYQNYLQLHNQNSTTTEKEACKNTSFIDNCCIGGDNSTLVVYQVDIKSEGTLGLSFCACLNYEFEKRKRRTFYLFFPSLSRKCVDQKAGTFRNILPTIGLLKFPWIPILSISRFFSRF